MTARLSLRFLAIPALIITLAGLGWSGSSWAISLHEAKAQGLVGEQASGYLGLVKPNASGAVKALMKDINAKRRKEYQAIARRNKTGLSSIETLAGKKAIARTPSGRYVKPRSGKWVKK